MDKPICMFCGEPLVGTFVAGRITTPDHSGCTEEREKVAANVRRAVEAHWPVVTLADLRRLFNLTDRRTINDRWNGRIPYSMAELVALSEKLGIRVADLLDQHDE